jgi:hypothetical protein
VDDHPTQQKPGPVGHGLQKNGHDRANRVVAVQVVIQPELVPGSLPQAADPFGRASGMDQQVAGSDVEPSRVECALVVHDKD